MFRAGSGQRRGIPGSAFVTTACWTSTVSRRGRWYAARKYRDARTASQPTRAKTWTPKVAVKRDPTIDIPTRTVSMHDTARSFATPYLARERNASAPIRNSVFARGMLRVPCGLSRVARVCVRSRVLGIVYIDACCFLELMRANGPLN